MKGVILAGGLGTRLSPLTRVANKHLLPVYDQPMVHYPIRTLVDAGIDEIMIVTGRHHADDFRSVLGTGRGLGVRNLCYEFQDGEGGIADALKLAEPFAGDERICVVLGDNIVERSIEASVQAYCKQSSGGRILLKEVHDPHRFGVARIVDGELLEIIEKPAQPPSSFAVTGIYMYDPDVFEICRGLVPSARGELEITDVNNAYLRRGDLSFDVLEGWWTDAGTFDSLLRASCLVSATRRETTAPVSISAREATAAEAARAA